MHHSHAELRQLPDDHWLVVLHGEHDVSTSPSLGDALAVIPRPREATVIVGLGTAEFICSTILNTILHDEPCDHLVVVREISWISRARRARPPPLTPSIVLSEGAASVRKRGLTFGAWDRRETRLRAGREG
jgi:hypothetical protein